MNTLIYENIIRLLQLKIKTGPYAHLTFEEKFWKQVNIKTNLECWEFTGKLFSNGYGCFRINVLDLLAHRISFLLNYKYIPSGNKIVMHICDNKKCVNPNHLKEGSYSDNMKDMLDKNRGNFSKGINNWRCKLTNKDVLEIIDARKNGIPGKELSKKYNVSCPQIYRIGNGQRRNYVNQ